MRKVSVALPLLSGGLLLLPGAGLGDDRDGRGHVVASHVSRGLAAHLQPLRGGQGQRRAHSRRCRRRRCQRFCCGGSRLSGRRHVLFGGSEGKGVGSGGEGGDGGDEAFLGYITFNALYGAKKIKLLPTSLLNILKTLTNYLPTSYSYLNLPNYSVL